MCLLEVSRLRIIAVIITSLFLAYLIALLTYCSLLTSKMRPEGVILKIDNYSTMQLFVISLSLAINIFGLIAFIFSKTTLILFYSVINSYILILSFWITISLFLLGNSSSSSFWVSDNLSICFNKNTTESNFSFTNEYRFNIDYFITSANDYFCTYECPCKVNKYPEFGNSSENLYYNFSTKGAINFQECSNTTKEKALIQSRQQGFKDNYNRVFKTMSWLEDQFSCTGFCIQTYTSSLTNKRRSLQNYLFSNINKGKPRQDPCVVYLVEWIKSISKEYGLMNIFIMIFDFILIIIGYSYYLSFPHVKENPTKTESTELKNYVKGQINDQNQDLNKKSTINVYLPSNSYPSSERIHVSTCKKG